MTALAPQQCPHRGCCTRLHADMQCVTCAIPNDAPYIDGFKDNDEITKSADGAFIGESGKKMNCGVQPTGFAISGTSAAVLFELYIKGSKTKASYAGQWPKRSTRL